MPGLKTICNGARKKEINNLKGKTKVLSWRKKRYALISLQELKRKKKGF